MLKESGRLPIIKETDDIAWVDVCPHLVGQKGIIDGTSAPYTTVDNQTKCDYSLKLIDMEGKTAWYNEEQLELNN